MRITRVSVGFEKRASDGDFGSELNKAELFCDLEPGEDPYTVLDNLLGMVRLQLERIEGEGTWLEPELCQQFGCDREAETWCPLCRAYLCLMHDPLTPIRKHDCLRGRAEAA